MAITWLSARRVVPLQLAAAFDAGYNAGLQNEGYASGFICKVTRIQV